MRIQHNIMAMNAYRNYNTNNKALAGNLEKLSSGYKINRAGDDAAGLAISEKMRAQITGLDAAQKNVKDGISLVKTAEGAMQEIQDMLNRMDYLATQSANGTYDDPVDRVNLNKEMDALKSEIDRIAESANFNGIKLLNGDRVDTDSSIATNYTADEIKGKTYVTLNTSATCCQFHKAGVASQHASFQIDLRQALNGVKASKAMAADATFSVKVSVGNATAVVKFKVNSALSTGAIIDFSSVTVKSIGTAGGSIAVTGADTKATIALTSTNSAGSAAKASFQMSFDAGVLKFEMKASKSAVDFNANMNVTITTSGSITMKVNGSANSGGDAAGVVSYNCTTQSPVNGVAKKGTQLAHAHFDLSTIADQIAVQGGVLRIGDKDIGFDASSKKVSGNMVGIKDLLSTDGTFDKSDDKKVAELARRISQAAADSDVFTVGVGSDGKTITLEEKWSFNGSDQYDEDSANFLSEDNLKEMVYFGQDETRMNATTTVTEGKRGALVLQIGDTSDSYNRLKVEIGDMHVKAMGQALDANGKNTGEGKSIKDIDIKTADSAKDAIQVIKNAINYVSSVRGDLGAIQNRLEHTGNNLSVMAENIQDAESTIRDTDVADEMMKYVKNNILVQSAQAMLAQANQVPQGVLQLLG